MGKREEKASPATISCNREKAKCQPGLEGCQAPKTGDTGVPKRDFIIIGHKLRPIIGACCPLIPRKETMTDDHFCSLLVASLPILRRHALHFAATSDEADDLLQDTILRLLEKGISIKTATSSAGVTSTCCTSTSTRYATTNTVLARVPRPCPKGDMSRT